MGDIVRRRVMVELALVREGEGLNLSRLARELGVSRWTVKRDVERVRERWAAIEGTRGRDLEAERARMVTSYEAVAAQAMAQYLRVMEEAPTHTVTVGCLRTVLEALDRRARLLGLEEAREWAERGEAEPVIVRFVDRLGRVRENPPWEYDD